MSRRKNPVTMTDHVALQLATHLFVHGTVLLAAAWLTIRLASGLPAGSKHAIWTAAFLALLLLPVGSWMIPGWGVDLTALRSTSGGRYAHPVVLTAASEAPSGAMRSPNASTEVGPPATEQATSPSPDESAGYLLLRHAAPWIAPAFLIVWGGGVLLLWGRLAVGMAALWRWKQSATAFDCSGRIAPLAHRLDVDRPFTVLSSPRARVPIVWGVATPAIILPADAQHWPPARLQSVLLHELAHVKRWDHLTHVLGRVARALFWPNPLIWMATERSRAAQEQACDDVVLQSGVAAWEYAEQLLAVAKTLRHRASPVEAVALNAGLRFKDRMHAILHPTTPHRSITRREAGAILLVGMLLWSTVSAFHLGPTAPQADRGALHWLEAEQTALPTAFGLREDERASGGTYVEITHRADDLDVPPPTHPATYAFETPHAGRYVIWARVRIRSDDHDSIWLRVDSTRWIRWNGIERSDRWHWVQVRDADQAGRPVAFDLSEGAHHLMLRQREDRLAIDRMLVTRNWNYQPRATGESAPPPNAPRQIWLEAEDGWLQAPLQVIHSPQASGWRHVEALPDASSRDAPPSSGHATYSFDVERGGTYRLWGRVIARSSRSDSFWIRMDDGPWIRWNGIQPGRRWHWDEVHDADRDDEPVRFDLARGAHRLTVAYRERHAKLDRLVLTNTPTYRPRGPGAPPDDESPFTESLSVKEASLTAPMVRQTDSASTDAWSWIEVPDGPGHDAPDGGPGAAIFTFTVPEPGRYVVWGRVHARAGNDNSFYVSMDGGEELAWHTPAPGATTDGWQWDPISNGVDDAFTDPVVFSLDAGRHQLRIRNREDGTRLRELRVTNKPFPIAP